MFVKVNDSEGRTRYINSDYITDIFIGSESASFYFPVHNDKADSYALDITLDSAAYFLASVEAQSALATEKAERPSLKSRIAQALRWDFPQGALPEYLVDFLALPSTYGKQPSEEDEVQVNTALNELMIEGVVTSIGLYYYHAANAPKPIPDPSNAAAETDSIPAESTAPIQDPNSAD